MSETKDTTKFIIAEMFESWKEKVWFQVLAVVVVVYLLVMPALAPMMYNSINRQNTSVAVEETMTRIEDDAKEAHRKAYEFSQQTYAIAKSAMRNYLNVTKCDYIFLIEYHNGNENPVTGIQFCRFDVTLEVTSENARFVPVEKFKDDIVARYDILLSDELSKNLVCIYSKDEFHKIDRYLEYQLNTIGAEAYAITNLRYNGKVYASLLFVSCDPNIERAAIYECANDMNSIFTSASTFTKSQQY